MGKIIISENVSLDGIADDPTGDEGSGHGHWTALISAQDREKWYQAIHEEALAAKALLIGRRSDAWFASRWLPRTGDQADRLNGMPKYVVSSTLEEPMWTNATILRGRVLTEVAKLKENLPGDIVVYGSIRLARTLLEHDLADELRLYVYPVVLGAGERLFTETGGKRPLRLIRTRSIGESLVQLSYEPAG